MRVGYLSEANLADAILEICRALQNFDFHPHKENGDVATIHLREKDGVLLGGHDDLRLPLFASVNHVDDLLLGEAVVVGETLRIDQLGANIDEALFEAFRLGDATERCDPFSVQKLETEPLASKNILEIERMVNAF